MSNKRKLDQRDLEELAEFSRPSVQGDEHPTREKIALETLERYAGCTPDKFQPFILLTNFSRYIDLFSEQLPEVEVTSGTVMRVAHCPEKEISIVDYRVGAPVAALIVDILSYIEANAVVMLGLCGGLHREQKVGDLFLPIAAIRDEGASRHYMPPQVPSLPAFMVQQMISQELMEQETHFKTGVLHTTDYRMWEFDEDFKRVLRDEKASAIDMECSALFTTAFRMKLPVGALMLISDLPLQPDGIKTNDSAQSVFESYASEHLRLGISAIARMVEETSRQKINFRRFAF